MLDWLKGRAANAKSSVGPAAPSDRGASHDTGQYRGLRDYLQDRYANRVVLTFAEIEDLLGFKLPEHARVEPAWWGAPVLPSTQSNAWTLAGRTAAVNLLAQSVIFERDAALDAPSVKG